MEDETLIRKLDEKDIEQIKKEFDRKYRLEMNEEDFQKLEKPSANLDKEKKEYHKNLKEAYYNILDILKEYLDLREDYYNIIALWIIGTYFHRNFLSYPFLYFNAIKGSGKSRAINLITTLAKDGEVLLSPTEAVLFRTTGTLGIDEFEGLKNVNRTGIDAIRELLNASYKKGSKVKRMKQKKTLEGIEQVVEEFDVYRPIVMANISGMEAVLGDRCIPLILERSGRMEITNLIEIFRDEKIVIETKKLLDQCTKCTCTYDRNVYREWNNFIKGTCTTYTTYTPHTTSTKFIEAFKVINLMDLRGRELELAFPLLLIAMEIEVENLEILNVCALTLKNVFDERKEEEMIQNKDIILLDFVSQETEEGVFKSMKKICQDFKIFSDSQEVWINPRWLGNALRRLNLILERRKMSTGYQIILNIKKAQEKIKIFKISEKLNKNEN